MHTRYTKLQLSNDYLLVVISKSCWNIKLYVIINNSNKDVYSRNTTRSKYEKFLMGYTGFVQIMTSKIHRPFKDFSKTEAT